jgi:hypothetical protein
VKLVRRLPARESLDGGVGAAVLIVEREGLFVEESRLQPLQALGRGTDAGKVRSLFLHRLDYPQRIGDLAHIDAAPY